MDYAKGVYRFGLVDRCTLPVSMFDKQQRKHVYCVLRGLFTEVYNQISFIIDLFKKNKNKRILDDHCRDASYKKVKIISTPWPGGFFSFTWNTYIISHGRPKVSHALVSCQCIWYVRWMMMTTVGSHWRQLTDATDKACSNGTSATISSINKRTCY